MHGWSGDISEIKFCQIPMQCASAAMLIGACIPRLNTDQTFSTYWCVLAASIFAARVIDVLMRANSDQAYGKSGFRQCAVSDLRETLRTMTLRISSAVAVNMEGADLSATLTSPNMARLPPGPTLPPLSGRKALATQARRFELAEIGFVSFDDFAAPHRFRAGLFHRFTNAVGHEPSRAVAARPGSA